MTAFGPIQDIHPQVSAAKPDIHAGGLIRINRYPHMMY